MEHAQLEKVLEKYERANPAENCICSGTCRDELEILDPYGGSLPQAYGLCYENNEKDHQKAGHSFK